MAQEWKKHGGLEAHLGIAPESAPPELIAAVDRRVAQRRRAGNGAAQGVGGRGTPSATGLAKWREGTERGVLQELRETTTYVNDALNRLMLRLFRAQPPEEWPRIEHLAIEACEINGLTGRDGISATLATIASAQNGARKYGPAYPEDRDDYQPGSTCASGSRADTLTASEAGFWESRESLSQIRDYALSGMVSPWGLLGVGIVYVLDTVPFSTALPGIADDDSPGSLNVFVNLVGASGGNKGRTCKMARRYLGRTEVDIPPGSGEGLVKIFVRRVSPDDFDKDGTPKVEVHGIGGDSFVFKRHAAVLDCAEVDSLLALGSRNGSTLFSILRQGFSGETLGFGYSDESKRLLVPGDQYRLGLIVGVQPERAAVLLDDAAGGTPQRFLWLPVTDPRASRANRPNKPAPLQMAHTRPWPTTFGMCDAAREEIETAAEERAQGIGDALDGHALFVRAKVAAALSVLDGERHAINEEDWQLAGTVMAISDLTRARCADALTRAAELANEARGRGEGIRTAIAGEIVHQRAIGRVAGVLVRAAQAHGPMTTAALRKRLAARDRALFDDAYALATGAGRLVEHEGQVKVP